MSFKKLFSFLVFLCCTAIVMSVSAYAYNFFGVSCDMGGEFMSTQGTASAHDGLITAKSATITDNYQYDDITKTTRIVPNTSYSGSEPIGIKHTSVKGMQYDLKSIKYVRYYYCYNGNSFGGKAKLVLPKSEFNLTKDCTVYSLENVVSGRWAYLTFDIQQVIYGYIFTDGILADMRFYPFGDTKPSAMASGDELFIREVSLLGEDNTTTTSAIMDGTLVQKYPVSFVPGRSDAKGTAPETVWAKAGEEITLPENTFTREGYSFAGWICSVGSKVMQPGEKYTLEERTRAGGQITAGLDFIAHWIVDNKVDGEYDLPDILRTSYTPFCGGIVDGRKYGTVTKQTKFDGLNVVKFAYDEKGADISKYSVSLDGWVWDTLPLDLAHYKCLIIPYYYKTTGNKNFTPQMNMLGGTDTRALLKSYAIKSSTGKLLRNQWGVMVFKFDYETDPTLNSLIRWDVNTVVNQIHFWMFGTGKASSLVAGDELYLGDFVFLSYVPDNLSSISFSKGFLSGDENGNMRPLDELTNAEAACILAKITGYTSDSEALYVTTAFTDINQDDWFLPYVSYLESKEVLSGNGKFYPEEKCTYSTYIQWIITAISGGVGAEAVGSIPESSYNGTFVTRADAVSLALGLINGGAYSLDDAQRVIGDTVLYPDVSTDQWFYPDIIFSSVPTLSYTGSEGKKVIDTYYNKPTVEEEFPAEKLTEGANYVQTLDKLTDKRIQEILDTPSKYTQKKGGKTVYVSSTGGDGTAEKSTENNPVYVPTLNDVSKIPLSAGDVLLFKRGETYRGSFEAVGGVTYSAYGEGDKPKLITSAENAAGKDKWILWYEDTETGKRIWKYYNSDLSDIGAINLISDSGKHLVAYKEIPSYYAKTFWVRGRTEVEEFDVVTHLDNDYEFVHLTEWKAGTSHSEYLLTSTGVPATDAVGSLYLRCDEGNPGTLYPRIELNGNYHTIKCKGHSITIDNLCLLYFGRHGVSAGTNNNLTVRNCEIGWGGGSVQSYNATNSTATRFGNGVEIYGALTNFVIDNCYVYEIYDAGITHQISSSSSGHYFMEGVYYTNNVLLNSTYNIEYFMSKNTVADADTGTVPLQERYMKNVYFTDNIVRMAGYGWGVQRPDSAPSNIKGWTHHNLADNYVIEDNIFDRCLDLQNFRTDYNVMLGSTYESSTPYMKNNIFVQVPGRILMTFNKSSYTCDINCEELLNKLSGTGNKVYFYPDDEKDYWGNVHWKDLEDIRGSTY